MTDTSIIGNARILTLAGSPGPRRGNELLDLGVIESGWIRVEGELISDIGEGPPPDEMVSETESLIDAGGSIVMPTYVDCHTHACWTGDRLDEFERIIGGESYLDILAEGGGIMSTVQAVRDADEEELEHALAGQLQSMLALGTGAVEVKSGYGLNATSELKMLRAIHANAQAAPILITGTFLGAHAIEPGHDRFIDETIEEILPAVVEEFPGIVCDAYCEEGAWPKADTVRYMERARELGCPVRVHADQFNSLGMTEAAIEMGALSVDHLEASTPDTLSRLADSDTIGVVLPCSGFHLDDRYADARAFLDAGGALALATNCNPGSSPTVSIPFTIALACRRLGLQPAEAITATTWNPACLLGMSAQVGSLEVGKRANLQILDCKDERQLGWAFAGPGPLLVMLGGIMVHARAMARQTDQPEEE